MIVETGVRGDCDGTLGVGAGGPRETGTTRAGEGAVFPDIRITDDCFLC